MIFQHIIKRTKWNVVSRIQGICIYGNVSSYGSNSCIGMLQMFYKQYNVSSYGINGMICNGGSSSGFCNSNNSIIQRAQCNATNGCSLYCNSGINFIMKRSGANWSESGARVYSRRCSSSSSKKNNPFYSHRSETRNVKGNGIMKAEHMVVSHRRGYCMNIPSLEKILSDIDIVSRDFPSISEAKLKEIKERISRGDYQLSPLRVYILDKENYPKEQFLHIFSILGLDLVINACMVVHPSEEDYLVLTSLGRSLNHAIQNKNLLLDNSFGLKTTIPIFFLSKSHFKRKDRQRWFI